MAYDFTSLYVTGLQVSAIKEFSLESSIGEHTKVSLRAVLPEEEKEKPLHEIKRWQEITVGIKKEDGKKQCLFGGVVTKVGASIENGLYELILEAKSATVKMDGKKKSRSFQDPSMTCHQLIKKVMEDYGGSDCMLQIPDRTIGEMTVQYEETDWEFIKRIVSRTGDALLPAADQCGIRFYAGFPELSVKKAVYRSVRYEKDMDSYFRMQAAGGSANVSSFLIIEADTYEPMVLGGRMKKDGSTYFIRACHMEMEKGLLKTTIRAQKKEGIQVYPIYPMNLVGAALNGTILEAKADQVKVHLEIDKEQSPGKACFMPYSTMSASNDGSGWYCMPEKGDKVRVCFPTKYTKDAVALSSVNQYKPPEGASMARRSGGMGAAGAALSGMTSMKGSMEVMEGGLAPIKSGMAAMREGIAPVKSGMAAMREGIAPVKSGMAAMREGIAPVKGGMAAMREGIAPVKSGMAAMREGIAPVKSGMAAMREGIAPVKGGMAAMDKGMPLSNKLQMPKGKSGLLKMDQLVQEGTGIQKALKSFAGTAGVAAELASGGSIGKRIGAAAGMAGLEKIVGDAISQEGIGKTMGLAVGKEGLERLIEPAVGVKGSGKVLGEVLGTDGLEEIAGAAMSGEGFGKALGRTVGKKGLEKLIDKAAGGSSIGKVVKETVGNGRMEGIIHAAADRKGIQKALNRTVGKEGLALLTDPLTKNSTDMKERLTKSISQHKAVNGIQDIALEKGKQPSNGMASFGEMAPAAQAAPAGQSSPSSGSGGSSAGGNTGGASGSAGGSGGGGDPMGDPNVVYLSTVHGKSLKLAPDGATLSCAGGAGVLTLSNSGDVTLTSTKSIEVNAEETIEISTDGEVLLKALEGIEISCDQGGKLELTENVHMWGTEVKVD